MTPWELQGRELINCSCSYGCPCQFNAPPSKGYCQAIGAIAIDRGHYGEVKLDGLACTMVLKWPGAIHEGHGECQPIVDARATPQQREGFLKILSGQDTDPFATVFAVFATTFEKVLEPIFVPIDLQIDVEARRARIRAGDIVQMDGEPIRNPVTGAEHRARIDLPDGFEYEIAEIGSGTSKASGTLGVTVQNSYAQFAHLHLNNHGVVRHRAA